jgi:hypothetical protein
VIRLEVISPLEQTKAVFKRWSTLTLSVCAVCLGFLLCVPLFVYWPEPYRPPQPPAAIEAVAPTEQAPPDDGGWVDATRPTRALVEFALDQGVAWLERSLAVQTPPPPKPAENNPPPAPAEALAASAAQAEPSAEPPVSKSEPSRRPRGSRRARKQYLRSSDGMTTMGMPGSGGPIPYYEPITPYTILNGVGTVPIPVPRSPMASYPCGAPTLDGTPCRRLVLGGGRCWQHRGY